MRQIPALCSETFLCPLVRKGRVTWTRAKGKKKKKQIGCCSDPFGLTGLDADFTFQLPSKILWLKSSNTVHVLDCRVGSGSLRALWTQVSCFKVVSETTLRPNSTRRQVSVREGIGRRAQVKYLEVETPEGLKDHGSEKRKKPGVRLSQHQEALTGGATRLLAASVWNSKAGTLRRRLGNNKMRSCSQCACTDQRSCCSDLSFSP